jgi:hypothetical protein
MARYSAPSPIGVGGVGTKRVRLALAKSHGHDTANGKTPQSNLKSDNARKGEDENDNVPAAKKVLISTHTPSVPLNWAQNK